MNPTHLFIHTDKVHLFRPEKPTNPVIWLLLTITGLFFYSHHALCQEVEKSFKPGPILLAEPKVAGNFGELRGNHFHSGIDFKTNETEGWPVLAADEGYVSRVKVSSTGYGKAIYITHPGGIVTVYGHLRAFYPLVEDSIAALQKEKRQFETEIFPDSNVFKVTQGQLIGFSGNSGGSEGPHLHFETRYQKSEKPFNPELTGYPIEDTIPPVIKALVIYHPEKTNNLQGAEREIIEIDSVSRLPKTQSLYCDKICFIGFEGFDLAGNEENHLGIRSYRIYNEDSILFECRIDSFSFDETRLINSLIDYSFEFETHRKIILCYILPGNTLPFYKKGNGLFTIRNNATKHLTLEVEDTKGNKTKIEFDITGKSERKNMDKDEFQATRIEYGKPLSIDSAGFKLSFGPKTFFENVKLNISRKAESDSIFLVPIVSLLPASIPVFEPIGISLKVADTSAITVSKMVMVRIDSVGTLFSVGGKFANGWLNAKTRSLGHFSIVVDTVAPVLMEPIFKEDIFSGVKKLVIPFKSDLSGIKSYECTIDGTWVCGEFNSNRNEIEIYFKEAYVPGTHFVLKLEIEDAAGNHTSQTREIIYPG